MEASISELRRAVVAYQIASVTEGISDVTDHKTQQKLASLRENVMRLRENILTAMEMPVTLYEGAIDTTLLAALRCAIQDFQREKTQNAIRNLMNQEGSSERTSYSWKFDSRDHGSEARDSGGSTNEPGLGRTTRTFGGEDLEVPTWREESTAPSTSTSFRDATSGVEVKSNLSSSVSGRRSYATVAANLGVSGPVGHQTFTNQVEDVRPQHSTASTHPLMSVRHRSHTLEDNPPALQGAPPTSVSDRQYPQVSTPEREAPPPIPETDHSVKEEIEDLLSYASPAAAKILRHALRCLRAQAIVLPSSAPVDASRCVRAQQDDSKTPTRPASAERQRNGRVPGGTLDSGAATSIQLFDAKALHPADSQPLQPSEPSLSIHAQHLSPSTGASENAVPMPLYAPWRPAAQLDVLQATSFPFEPAAVNAEQTSPTLEPKHQAQEQVLPQVAEPEAGFHAEVIDGDLLGPMDVTFFGAPSQVAFQGAHSLPSWGLDDYGATDPIESLHPRRAELHTQDREAITHSKGHAHLHNQALHGTVEKPTNTLACDEDAHAKAAARVKQWNAKTQVLTAQQEADKHLRAARMKELRKQSRLRARSKPKDITVPKAAANSASIDRRPSITSTCFPSGSEILACLEPAHSEKVSTARSSASQSSGSRDHRATTVSGDLGAEHTSTVRLRLAAEANIAEEARKRAAARAKAKREEELRRAEAARREQEGKEMEKWARRDHRIASFLKRQDAARHILKDCRTDVNSTILQHVANIASSMAKPMHDKQVPARKANMTMIDPEVYLDRLSETTPATVAVKATATAPSAVSFGAPIPPSSTSAPQQAQKLPADMHVGEQEDPVVDVNGVESKPTEEVQHDYWLQELYSLYVPPAHEAAAEDDKGSPELLRFIDRSPLHEAPQMQTDDASGELEVLPSMSSFVELDGAEFAAWLQN